MHADALLDGYPKPSKYKDRYRIKRMQPSYALQLKHTIDEFHIVTYADEAAKTALGTLPETHTLCYNGNLGQQRLQLSLGNRLQASCFRISCNLQGHTGKGVNSKPQSLE